MSVFQAIVLTAGLLGQQSPEERVDDTEYERNVAVHVRAVESIEKSWKKDPAAALKAIEALLKTVEEELAPRYSRVIESNIAVRATRGIDKGEVKERHEFFPYRLAGEIALAAGEPERAVAHLQKSPTGAALLAGARKAVAGKDKKDPAPATTPAPPPKPTFDPKPFLEKRDFAGALEALRVQPAALPDADKIAEEIRREAAHHQQATLAVLAGVLPRLDQPGFRKDHLEPCLKACSRLPADVESDELRWVRRLDRWIEKRDPAEFESLALAAAKFGGDFTVLADRAQDNRLREIEQLVQTVNQAARNDRARLLDQLGQAERALGELAAARPRGDLKDRLWALKSKLPLDDKALDEARNRPTTIADIRRLADELDRLWVSDRRARLSVPDQKDLALLLGVYRCMALFLEGKTVAQAAQDLRLVEVFRSAGELPADVSPKVAAVRARILR
jgi:hypothetical protein